MVGAGLFVGRNASVLKYLLSREREKDALTSHVVDLICMSANRIAILCSILVQPASNVYLSPTQKII